MKKEQSNKKEILEELGKISPLLQNLKRNQIKETEDEVYFDQLKSKLEQISTQGKPTKTIAFRQWINISVAACLVVFIGIKMIAGIDDDKINYQLTDNEVQEYILESIEDWNEEIVEEFVLENDIEGDYFSFINETAADEYLTENISELDIEDLYN